MSERNKNTRIQFTYCKNICKNLLQLHDWSYNNPDHNYFFCIYVTQEIACRVCKPGRLFQTRVFGYFRLRVRVRQWSKEGHRSVINGRQARTLPDRSFCGLFIVPKFAFEAHEHHLLHVLNTKPTNDKWTLNTKMKTWDKFCNLHGNLHENRPLLQVCIYFKQKVKVIWQKAPHGGPIPG